MPKIIKEVSGWIEIWNLMLWSQTPCYFQFGIVTQVLKLEKQNQSLNDLTILMKRQDIFIRMYQQTDKQEKLEFFEYSLGLSAFKMCWRIFLVIWFDPHLWDDNYFSYFTCENTEA